MIYLEILLIVFSIILGLLAAAILTFFFIEIKRRLSGSVEQTSSNTEHLEDSHTNNNEQDVESQRQLPDVHEESQLSRASFLLLNSSHFSFENERLFLTKNFNTETNRYNHVFASTPRHQRLPQARDVLNQQGEVRPSQSTGNVAHHSKNQYNGQPGALLQPNLSRSKRDLFAIPRLGVDRTTTEVHHAEKEKNGASDILQQRINSLQQQQHQLSHKSLQHQQQQKLLQLQQQQQQQQQLRLSQKSLQHQQLQQQQKLFQSQQQQQQQRLTQSQQSLQRQQQLPQPTSPQQINKSLVSQKPNTKSSTTATTTNLNKEQNVISPTNFTTPHKTRLDLHYFTLKDAMDEFKSFLNTSKQVYLNSSKSRQYRFIEVITGRGKHSPGGIPVIKPAVDNYLTKHDYTFHWSNPGMVRIDLMNSP